MRRTIVLAVFALTLVTGTALADSLDGRLGFTGKAGALVPLRDDFISSTTGAKAGLAAGGGLIFGLCRNFAVEADVNQVLNLDVELNGSKVYEATLTDVALGAQYRFASGNRLVPFLGAGADFIKGTLKVPGGAEYDMDWTVGGHVNAGIDYFITSGIALTAEVRGVLAAKGDINSAGTKVGEYNPRSFLGTLGLRFVLPKNIFD